MNAEQEKVDLASDDGYKFHLIKEVLQQNEEFKHEVDNVVSNKIQDHIVIHQEKSKASGLKEIPAFFPGSPQLTLIGEKTLVLPFSRGTNYFREEAMRLPGNRSGLFKKVTYVDLDTGEINLALVQGQLLSMVYPNSKPDMPREKYGNGTCGSLTKFMNLGSPYPFDVMIKSITRIWMPSDRDAVFLVDAGTLDISNVGVHGNTFNSLSYQKPDGNWVSRLSNRVFLDVNKTAGGTLNDFFQHEYVQENKIILPAGVSKFNFNVLAQIRTFTSVDFSNTEGLDDSNYGLAFVDLRSRLMSGRDPILTIPFTGGFKPAPGGIRVQTTFEFYEL